MRGLCHWRLLIPLITASIVFILLIVDGAIPIPTRLLRSAGAKGDYKLPIFEGVLWRTGNTLTHDIVYEDTSLRLERHSIRLGTSESSPVIHDWMWIDLPNKIVVLVESKGRFLLQWGIHYGSREPTPELISGIVENLETPEEAAFRTVSRELGMTVGELYQLGPSLRVDMERGLGNVIYFLAVKCEPLEDGEAKEAPSRLSTQTSATALRLGFSALEVITHYQAYSFVIL